MDKYIITSENQDWTDLYEKHHTIRMSFYGENQFQMKKMSFLPQIALHRRFCKSRCVGKLEELSCSYAKTTRQV